MLFMVIRKRAVYREEERLLIPAVPIPVLARQGLLSSTLFTIVENGITRSVPGGLVPVRVKAEDHMKPPAVFDESFGYDEVPFWLQQSLRGVTGMGAE